jgi:ADP-heptose:LPS heptosyltransferase
MLPIGDTLFLTPTIRALRARHPHARIVALARRANAPILRCVPEVDAVRALPFGVDWAGPARLAHALVSLRADAFDVAVDFTSPAYKWISISCDIPIRTYMKFDPGWWFLPGEHPRWRSTHATRHYYDCARELDLPPWSAVSHEPRLTLSPSARQDAREFLRARGLWPLPGPLVALHPGGAGLGSVKHWPLERFACVAERLCLRWGARVLVLGGPEDVPLAASLAAHMETHTAASPILAAGVLPLLTTAALLEASGLFIGNDSGLLHLATALSTSYVGIFGPTNLGNFRPIPVRPHQGGLVLPAWRCFSPRYFVGGSHALSGPCCEKTCAALETIAVARVVRQAESLLAARFSPLARAAVEPVGTA